MHYTAIRPDEVDRLREVIALASTYERGGGAPLPRDRAVECIYKGRNRLYRVSSPEWAYVVKCFGQLSPLRALYYRYLGRSKAERSHTYALELVRRGVGTPMSLGYAERRTLWGIAESYQVSEAIDYTEADIHPHMRGWTIPDGFADALGAFIAQAHEAGVTHLDLSPGNILYRYDRATRRYHFYLVDLNRMRLYTAPLTLEQASANVARLSSHRGVTTLVAHAYAEARGLDPQRVAGAMTRATDRFWLGRLPRMARRWSRRHRGVGSLHFATIYLSFVALGWLERCVLIPEGLRRRLHQRRAGIYIDYLSVEDIRHVLRHRSRFGYEVAYKDRLHQ